jgi:putative transport protein
MDNLIEYLNQNSIVSLFLIITLGIIVGRIKIHGFSLDLSAVILVALAFGHVGMSVSGEFMKFGLLLFMFTIGIQAGPGFFEAFKKHGRELIITSLVLIFSGAVTAYVLILVFDIEPDLGIGIFTGAMTSTPGLAAAAEATQSSQASIGYGIAYTFGVVGVIISFTLLPKIFRINIHNEEEEFGKSVEKDFPAIQAVSLCIQNSVVSGKSIKDLQVGTMTGVRISRVMSDTNAITPDKDTVLYTGNIVRVVGTRDAIDRAKLLLGNETDQAIPLSEGYEIEWVLVTNKEIVGKRYNHIALTTYYHATVLKIRRSGIEITPRKDSKFRFGDKLMIACDKNNLRRVRKLLGNDNKKLSSTNFLPIVMGIFLGFLVGNINIPFIGINFNLGLTGGTLIVGLVLSRIGKTGPIIWNMSGTSTQILRELGLLLFMAAIGTEAGRDLAVTMETHGIVLLLSGMIITVVPIITGAIFGRLYFKMNFLTLLGVIAGAMTSTPGLAIANSRSPSNAAAIAYASVYPAALVMIIIAAQILVKLLF